MKAAAEKFLAELEAEVAEADAEKAKTQEQFPGVTIGDRLISSRYSMDLSFLRRNLGTEDTE